jgi:hypothetical protein
LPEGRPERGGMTNLIQRVKEIRQNLATARDEYKIVDELLEQESGLVTPDDYRAIAERMRAVAAAKEGDWFTHTFTPSTAAELRFLADAYDDIAKEPLLWQNGRPL